MAASRTGNFSMTVRWIDCVKPAAKRVSVRESTGSFDSSGAAWQRALRIRKAAETSYGILLVNLTIREDDEIVWQLQPTSCR